MYTKDLVQNHEGLLDASLSVNSYELCLVAMEGLFLFLLPSPLALILSPSLSVRLPEF